MSDERVVQRFAEGHRPHENGLGDQTFPDGDPDSSSDEHDDQLREGRPATGHHTDGSVDAGKFVDGPIADGPLHHVLRYSTVSCTRGAYWLHKQVTQCRDARAGDTASDSCLTTWCSESSGT